MQSAVKTFLLSLLALSRPHFLGPSCEGLQVGGCARQAGGSSRAGPGRAGPGHCVSLPRAPGAAELALPLSLAVSLQGGRDMEAEIEMQEEHLGRQGALCISLSLSACARPESLRENKSTHSTAQLGAGTRLAAQGVCCATWRVLAGMREAP